MIIEMNEGMLSDLFFNHDHANWNRIMGGSNKNESIPTYEEIIGPDAEEFASLLNGQVDVDWLVKDFCRRV